MPSKIVHVHVPKTAGKSLRAAFREVAKKFNRKFFETDGFTIDQNALEEGQFDLISGHFGFCHAEKIPNASFITMLRDPKDRFLSFYYYLREKFAAGENSRRSRLANRYDLDEFVYLMDDPDLVDDLLNSVTWQLAYGTRQLERLSFRMEATKSDDDLLNAAIANLDRCELVGFQDDYSDFARKFEQLYGIPLTIRRENMTKSRLSVTDVSARTLRKIDDWVYLDSEVYRYALGAFRNK